MTPPNPTGEQMGEWIEHDGGGCPVDAETEVEATSRKGWTITCPAAWLKWPNVKKYRLHPTSPSQQGEQQ